MNPLKTDRGSVPWSGRAVASGPVAAVVRSRPPHLNRTLSASAAPADDRMVIALFAGALVVGCIRDR